MTSGRPSASTASAVSRREADVEAHGWKAFVTRYAAVEESEHPQLALYCPECAERAFGDAGEELSD
jgi:hypothetical protein